MLVDHSHTDPRIKPNEGGSSSAADPIGQYGVSNTVPSIIIMLVLFIMCTLANDLPCSGKLRQGF